MQTTGSLSENYPKPRKFRPFRVIFYLLLGVISFTILINVWVAMKAAKRTYSSVESIPARKVGLVLGTTEKLANGRKNAYFSYRIDAAVALYKAGKVKKLIVSGDNGSENYDETTAMRDALVRRGVPARDIVMDYAGFRTLDSVVRAKSVFDQNEIIVVSQEFHIQRAVFIGGAKGVDVIGYVAKDPLTTKSTIKVMLREVLARVKAFLDCYILGTAPKFPGPKEPIVF